jgi:hypothetical protein
VADRFAQRYRAAHARHGQTQSSGPRRTCKGDDLSATVATLLKQALREGQPARQALTADMLLQSARYGAGGQILGQLTYFWSYPNDGHHVINFGGVMGGCGLVMSRCLPIDELTRPGPSPRHSAWSSRAATARHQWAQGWMADEHG